MKKLNKMSATFVMTAILVFGTTAANAGILVYDATGSETRTSQTCSTNDKPDWGILVYDLVGILVYDLTGIPTAKSTTQTNCGILVYD